MMYDLNIFQKQKIIVFVDKLLPSYPDGFFGSEENVMFYKKIIAVDDSIGSEYLWYIITM